MGKFGFSASEVAKALKGFAPLAKNTLGGNSLASDEQLAQQKLEKANIQKQKKEPFKIPNEEQEFQKYLKDPKSREKLKASDHFENISDVIDNTSNYGMNKKGLYHALYGSEEPGKHGPQLDAVVAGLRAAYPEDFKNYNDDYIDDTAGYQNAIRTTLYNFINGPKDPQKRALFQKAYDDARYRFNFEEERIPRARK